MLVADPLPIFRSAVQALLARTGGFEVCDAADADEFVATVAERRPRVALVELDLPPAGAIAALADLPHGCRTRVVVWSFAPDTQSVLEAICAGASGFLDKRIDPAGLIRALRGIDRGEAPLSRSLAGLMVRGIHERERRSAARERAGALSARETEVLQMVAAGLKNGDIAVELCLSRFTVKRHLQNILEKLRAPTRAVAAEVYRRAQGDPAGALVATT